MVLSFNIVLLENNEVRCTASGEIIRGWYQKPADAE